jgi:beta-glucanase (GH16 family)
MGKFELAWQDEFDTDGAPDPGKWSFETGAGGWGNNELQCYTDSIRNAYVSGGKLIIRAFREESGGAAYTSAKLTTYGKAAWLYGRVEVRARLPRGAGSWPAIWMLPVSIQNGEDWPLCGEIDIMEHVGKDEDMVHVTVHSALYHHVAGTQRTHFEKLEGVTKRFHDYAMEWTPEAVEYFFDGRPVAKFMKNEPGRDATANGWPFDKPYYLILNVAVGGNWGGPVDDAALPFVMEVEHVRVSRYRQEQ